MEGYPEVTLSAGCDLCSGRSRPGDPGSGKTDESGCLTMTNLIPLNAPDIHSAV